MTMAPVLATPSVTTHAVRLGAQSKVAIALVSAVGLVAFIWPLVAAPESAAVAHATDAPMLFAVVVPMLLVVVLAQVNDGGMDAKSIAMLGVLAAVIAALRPLGGGTAGLEPIWVVLILGGRALGPGFGFCLGAISLFASALITGGVGPWLPFQMLGAAWVGMGAGSSLARPAAASCCCSPPTARRPASPTASCSTCGSGRSPRACPSSSPSPPVRRWPRTSCRGFASAS